MKLSQIMGVLVDLRELCERSKEEELERIKIKRNTRDNLFVLNAINNSVTKGNEDSVDIQLFDAEKCFDTLWVEECIYDLYEAGLDNDKLLLLVQRKSKCKNCCEDCWKYVRKSKHN